MRRLATTLGALVVLASAAPPGGAAAQESTRIGERLYVVLFDHNPSQFSNALRAADEFLNGHPGRRFEIIMDYYGMFAAIPGTTTVQREYVDIKRRNGGLNVVVCKETVDQVAKNNKRRVPLLPGMKVASCKDRRVNLEKDGWRAALGF